MISLFWNLAWLVLAPIGTCIFIREWNRNTLVIESFDIPKELQDLGLNGSVIAQLTSDMIFELLRGARIDDDASDIVFIELPKLQIDLQVPGLAWSVRGLIRYLKQILNIREKRILGEVVLKRHRFHIRLRTTSGHAGDVPVSFNRDLHTNLALRSAAELAISLMDPFEAASIHFGNESPSTGYEKTLASLRFHLATVPADRHEDAYVLWASVHRALGEYDAMKEKLRLAKGSRISRITGRPVKHRGTRYSNFMGTCHREEFLFTDAEAMFRKALKVDGRNISAATNMGLLDYNRWRLDKAERWFRRVIRLRPNSSRGHRGLGLVALRSRRFSEALTCFQRAIDVAPAARWPKINLIETLQWQGNMSAALAEIEKLHKADADFAPLHRVWADYLRETGMILEALHRFDHAVRLDPYDPWARLGRADVLRRLGRYDEAIVEITEVLKVRKDFPEALWRWAEVLRDQLNVRGAESKVTQAIHAVPSDPYLRLRLAEVLRWQGRYDEAIDAVTEARVMRNVGWPEALMRWAEILLDKSDVIGAEQRFRDAIEVAPEFCWPYLGLAESLRKQQRFDEACSAIGEALLRRPDWHEALLRHAGILQEQGKLEAAEFLYRRASELVPQDLRCHTALANLSQLQNDLASAD